MSKFISAKTFILSTSIVLTSILASCGGGNSKTSSKAFDSSALLAEERALNQEERNIATRICYSFATKSKNFRSTPFFNTPFKFRAKVTDCQNGVTSYDIPTILKYDNQNNLEYTPVAGFDPNLRFNRKVQTDTSGFLAQVCPKILANEEVLNTTVISNIKVQITFTKEIFDGFILTYFNQQTDLSFKIDSAEKFQFRTPFDTSNGKIIGMDELYSAQKICGSSFDKNKFSNFEQTFISH